MMEQLVIERFNSGLLGDGVLWSLCCPKPFPYLQSIAPEWLKSTELCWYPLADALGA